MPQSGLLLVWLYLAIGNVCSAQSEIPQNGSVAAAPVGNSDSFFATQIAPILSKRCFECHGGEEEAGGWSLATVAGLFQAGDSGKVGVLRGDSHGSELVRRLRSEDEDLLMPSGGPPLAESEIRAIEQWIAAGAELGVDQVNREKIGAEARLVDLYVRRVPAAATPEVYPRGLGVVAMAIGEVPSADATQIVITGGYGELLVWKVGTGQLWQRVGGLGQHIAAIEIVGADCFVAHGVPGEVGAVTQFRIQALDEGELLELERVREICTSEDVPTSVAVAAVGQQVAVGFQDGAIEVFSLAEGTRLQRLVIHADGVTDLCWGNDGALLLTGSRDRTAKGIEIESMRTKGSYTQHERAVVGVLSTDAGPMTIDETGELRLWSNEGSGERASRGGYRGVAIPAATQRLAGEQGRAGDQWVLIATNNQIQRTQLTWEEVEDGRDDKGEIKRKRVPRWSKATPLEVERGDRITSLVVGQQGEVFAGTFAGRVYGWLDLRVGDGAGDVEAGAVEASRIWEAWPK